MPVNKKPFKLYHKTLYSISLVLFFAQDAFRVLIATALPFLSYKATICILILLMYFPLVCCIVKEKRKSDLTYVYRFLMVLLFVALTFAISYLVHPEYHDWYFAGSYPIWDRIFRPNQFLYAVLFVGAVDDPKELLKALKITAFILLAYYTYRFLIATMRGYWIITTTSAGPQQSQYDLNFGYDQLLVLSIFLCSAFREKKPVYAVFAGISLVEIILGGSRGPLLAVALLSLMLYFKYRKNISKAVRTLVLFLTVLFVAAWLLLGIEGIAYAFGSVLSKIAGGQTSRTIETLMGGSDMLLDGSSRDRVYGDAIQMIKSGFWGYGAYGDRYVLGRWLWTGYCHQIFLELLIDYGWILGGIFCIAIIVNSIKMLVKCREDDWWFCFVVFFIPSIKLLLSGSFWFLDAFWAGVTVYMMYKKRNRSEKVNQWGRVKIVSR